MLRGRPVPRGVDELAAALRFCWAHGVDRVSPGTLAMTLATVCLDCGQKVEVRGDGVGWCGCPGRHPVRRLPYRPLDDSHGDTIAAAVPGCAFVGGFLVRA